MHLILTHEQADFDAVASLLAARLLAPDALAVLPRRLNRNVRAYLTLYGEKLPFIEFGDIPRRGVESVTLVDTQSLVSVKGIGPKTSVHVVDHHPPADDLDSSWTSHSEGVGATTTLLVETIRESSIELDLVTATMFLLGIYEDTGSLSYPGTTARDIRAASWLVEHGGSLTIATDFLNHPLSPSQRRLFDQLMEAAETFEFHGVSIVIACGLAEGMVDEISTVAHKLRDIFDPQGLIILVGQDGSVQMVGRSSTALLDISRVAEHFGGGGHSRAAAALIRDSTIEQTCEELLSLLPQVVEPVKTVGEIMSRGPQLLHPGEDIETAAEHMQRFGHEGYPVVEEDKVVGLLTRRAVDRAMTHGMGERPVSTIMEAGDHVVHPSDSIQHLQSVMIQYGWGQVPVADSESGEIIGIVTRTDLLKELGAALEGTSIQSLRDQLEEALPSARLAILKLIARNAMVHGDALYIVGGFVRDLILGAPSVDFDLVVEGDAIRLANGLASAFGGRVSSHSRFGTAKWWLDWSDARLLDALGIKTVKEDDLPGSLDFVTARTEFYPHPTALPSVEQGSIKLDLHRRDFTVNTLALRLDGRSYGQLLDPWGGGRDIREKLIRVLHSISFVDDPTRMLRAVRLEQRMGFQLETRTRELLHQAVPLLDRVSGERIRNELKVMFGEKCTPAIMKRLQELNLLTAIHPALIWDGWLEARFEEIATFMPDKDWKLSEAPDVSFLRYAMLCFRLSEDEVQAVSHRLHFPTSMMVKILEANRIGREFNKLVGKSTPSAIVAYFEGFREESLAAAWLALAEQKEAQSAIASYLREWRHISSTADGVTLRNLDLPPGPKYKQILWTLRAAWIDGEISSAAEEEALLQQLVEEARDHG
jgi:tRNA nucleotidyltransferase (CCA-adding enzyme)